ncbi:MAG: copper resistance CopC family protein, partial [Jiangellaceae bacterium]
MDNTDRRRLSAPVGRVLLALAAVLAVLLPGAPAWAHNSLVDAQPAKNATLAKAPATVRLSFLQKLNPEFTTIKVTDAAQREVPADPPEVANKVATLTFTTPPENGAYTVAYQVVSTDGHTVKGSYKFTVDDPSAATSSPAPATTSPTAAAPVAEPAAEESSSGTGWIWIVVLAVLAAAALAGFFVMRS